MVDGPNGIKKIQHSNMSKMEIGNIKTVSIKMKTMNYGVGGGISMTTKRRKVTTLMEIKKVLGFPGSKQELKVAKEHFQKMNAMVFGYTTTKTAQ